MRIKGIIEFWYFIWGTIFVSYMLCFSLVLSVSKHKSHAFKYLDLFSLKSKEVLSLKKVASPYQDESNRDFQKCPNPSMQERCHYFKARAQKEISVSFTANFDWRQSKNVHTEISYCSISSIWPLETWSFWIWIAKKPRNKADESVKNARSILSAVSQ